MIENTAARTTVVFGLAVFAYPRKRLDFPLARKEPPKMLNSIGTSFTKKFYIAIFLWVIIGSVAGIFIYDKWSRGTKEEKLAPLASQISCGEKKVMTDRDLADQAKKWLVNETGLTSDVRRAMLRNLSALPDLAAKSLSQRGIRFTIGTGQAPYTCGSPSAEQPMPGVSCVKATPKDGLFAIINAPTQLAPDGKNLTLPIDEQLESTILPISFWVLFQGLWLDENPKPPLDTEVSQSNRMVTLKKYLVSSYKFSRGEESYYHGNFTASGRESPTFLTRSLILTASNIYCSKASYENLLAQQPEAVRRFWFVYGCTLGKPWFMTDDEFTKTCDQSMSQAK